MSTKWGGVIYSPHSNIYTSISIYQKGRQHMSEELTNKYKVSTRMLKSVAASAANCRCIAILKFIVTSEALSLDTVNGAYHRRTLWYYVMAGARKLPIDLAVEYIDEMFATFGKPKAWPTIHEFDITDRPDLSIKVFGHLKVSSAYLAANWILRDNGNGLPHPDGIGTARWLYETFGFEDCALADAIITKFGLKEDNV